MKYIANVFVTSGRNIESNNIESFEEKVGPSNSCFIIEDIFCRLVMELSLGCEKG
jgi:hypothetical protein